MATLTVADDRLSEVDEYAKEEERSREDIVNEAIYMYLREKKLNAIRDRIKSMGITEEDIFEEVRQCRKEMGASGI